MAIDLTAVTFAELRYAVALHEHRHFGRAARACNVTQPTLSAQIQKLERTLGLTLFERSSKSVQPTTAGERIIEQARAVLDATETIRDIAESGHLPLSGPLRLGVIPTLGPYLLPHFVPALRAEYPKVELILRELKTSDLLEDLAQHRLDCGLLATPIPLPGIVSEELFEEPFHLLARRDHELAKKKRLVEGDLAGQKVLLLDEGHCLRDQALSLCRETHANESQQDFRATSLETLRHMVAAGMGTTLLPALALRKDEGELVALAFEKPAPGRRVTLAWRKTHPRAADFRELAQFIRLNLPPGVTPVSGKPRTRA
ncbi:MAG: LysR family transcriptional regulator [Planctomycetes bacterium]|nr:LysR family transcriptional regulator [Planctomycetota bacterium]